MEIIGHRGASGLAPENTLASFRLAADLGVIFGSPDHGDAAWREQSGEVAIPCSHGDVSGRFVVVPGGTR
mgnify:CR=1 FL=1